VVNYFFIKNTMTSIREWYLAAQEELIAATWVDVDERVLDTLDEIKRKTNVMNEEKKN